MRRDAREAVFKLIYSYLMTGEVDGEMKTALYGEHKLTDKDVAFANTLICGITENEKAINEAISELSVGYTMERINYTDRVALMLGMCELLTTGTDVPVIVDEAVSLCKKYSGESSLAFVNGILGEYAKRLGK